MKSDLATEEKNRHRICRGIVEDKNLDFMLKIMQAAISSHND